MRKGVKNHNKPDFYGYSPRGRGLDNPKREELKNTKNDDFMLHYYSQHLEDFENPQHNLKGTDIAKYVKRPRIDIGVAGVLYYISNKSCKVLVDHMEKIYFDIFHFDEFTQSYPYTIEDCAASFILYYNGIGFSYGDDLFTMKKENQTKCIAFHTNKYK